MYRRLALAGVLAVTLTPGAAAAGTMRLDARTAPDQRTERLSQVASIPLPDPVPPVVDAPCPTLPEPACTRPGGAIYVWRSGPFYSTAPDLIPEAVAHELGHHVDFTLMTDFLRDKFRALIGDPRPWITSPQSPHEQFAEAYAACALRLGTNNGYGYQPSRRLHRRICLFMSRLHYLRRSLKIAVT